LTDPVTSKDACSPANSWWRAGLSVRQAQDPEPVEGLTGRGWSEDQPSDTDLIFPARSQAGASSGVLDPKAV